MVLTVLESFKSYSVEEEEYMYMSLIYYLFLQDINSLA